MARNVLVITVMRIAVPVWNGRVSPVFDTARRMMVTDVENGRRILNSEVQLGGVMPHERMRSVVGLGATVLICGGISPELAAMLGSAGVRVIPGMSGDVDEILDAFVSGRIQSPTYFMPGWRGWRRRRGCARRHRWPGYA